MKSDFIVIGTFRRRPDSIVAFTRILDGSSGETLHQYRQRSQRPDNFRFFQQVREITQKALPGLKAANKTIKNSDELILPASKRVRGLKGFEYYVLGRKAFWKGGESNYRVAATWYREAIKYDFKYALGYIGLAETLAHWGFERKINNRSYQDFYRKAHDQIRIAKKYDPTISFYHYERSKKILDADIDFVVGETHLKNKQWGQALAAYRLSLSKTPEDAYTLYRMGEAYLGLGEMERARHHFASALEINPSLIPAIDRLEYLLKLQDP